MPASTPIDALATLRRMARAGTLDALCERYRLGLLVAFGSTVFSRDDRTPRDIDLAFCAGPGGHVDVLGLLNALIAVLGLEAIDLMDLDRAGVVARYRALQGTAPLFEHRRGLYAERQMAAALEFLDTAWLRRLDLALMAAHR